MEEAWLLVDSDKFHKQEEVRNLVRLYGFELSDKFTETRVYSKSLLSVFAETLGLFVAISLVLMSVFWFWCQPLDDLEKATRFAAIAIQRS